MDIENNYGNISNLFVRLIGYINLILQFESYKENYSDYSEILKFINKWAVQYEKQRNLKFIDNNDLIAIYEKSDVIYNCIYDNIVDYCVEQIEQGNYDKAYNRYKNSVLTLEEQFAKPYLQQRFIKVLKRATI